MQDWQTESDTWLAVFTEQIAEIRYSKAASGGIDRDASRFAKTVTLASMAELLEREKANMTTSERADFDNLAHF